ncbi:CapA family protein [Candidatus Parcubacteria bacterium]|nr:MAG: CapA family protein [Candidatus Parcubacteria bacterium]
MEYRKKIIFYIGFIFFTSILCVVLLFSVEHARYILRQKALSGLQTNEEIRKNYEKQREKRKPLSLLFVGDIMLSRAIDKKIIEHADDARFPFLLSSEKITQADIAMGNLEGPISENGSNQGSIYSFRARPMVVGGLQYAGFDIVTLANNHMFDWGRRALLDTMHILTNANILYTGAGKDYVDANELKIIRKNGFVAGFLAYTNLYPPSLFATQDKAGISEYNEEYIKKYIHQQKNSVDLLIVSLHWGEEYKTNSTDEQKRIAREFIDAGADIIIGHHPHVPQEIEEYKGKWIAYSLGNFVFDQYFSKETMSGLALDVTCTKAHTCSAQPIHVELNKDFQPAFVGL